MKMARTVSGSFLSMMMAGLLLVPTTPASVSAQVKGGGQATQPNEIVFIPPAIGAPADRLGAATRDLGQDSDMLSVLAPAGGGMTTLGKPPLVWHLADSFAGRMTARLAPIGSSQEGVEISNDSRFRKGFYALDLSRADFELEPGKIYEWTVVLAVAGTGEANAAVTTYVERTDAPGLVGADGAALAAKGMWFDALEPFVEVELSGKVRVDQGAGFAGLIRSAGIALP